MTADAHGSITPPPRVWVLLAQKAGDNEQMLALAEALRARYGWPFETRRLRFHRWELAVNLGLRVSPIAVDRRRSDSLAPPWPDLVLTAGRRNEPVARWIRRASKGRTRLVHLGRPWAHPATFDLVVSTPQYPMEESANVIVNTLPLNRVTPQRLAAARERWASRFEHLPRPHLALLLGGDSGPLVLDPARARAIAAESAALARRHGGSLLVTTSARTPPPAADAASAPLDVPAFLHRFDQAGAGSENPYWGFLADADAFIVTGESMSMLGEASATGRPVLIADLTQPPPGAPSRAWWRTRAGWRWKPLSYRLGTALGPRRMRRDLARIQQTLVEQGAAAWLGEPIPDARTPPTAADLARTIKRVAACLERSASA